MRIFKCIATLTSILSFSALVGCNSGSNNTTLSLDNTSYTLTQGGTTTVVISNSASAQANNIAVTGLPSGVSTSGCNDIAAGTSCSLTLTATSSATTGTVSIHIAGSNTNTVSANLTVSSTISGLTALNGPEGAFATSLVSNSTTLYLSTPGAGVFTASASGSPLSWSTVNSGLTNKVVRALALDPSDNLYAATTNGVFKLASGSSTWTELTTTGLGNTNISAIAADNTGDVFAIGPPNGNIPGNILYELPNGSSSWTNLLANDPSHLANSPNGKVIYSDSSGHIYIWNGTRFADTLSSVVAGNIAIDNSNNIYVTDSTTNNLTIYKGSLSGTWTYTQMGGTLSNGITNIAIDNLGTIFVGGANAIYQWDGSTWNQIATSWSGFAVSALAAVNGRPYVGTLNGILIPNGGSFSLNDNGLTAGDSILGSLLFYNNILYAGYTLPVPSGDQMPLVSYYSNGNWTKGGNFAANLSNAFGLQVQGNTIYAATGQGLYTSTDATSWSLAGANAPTGDITKLIHDTTTTTTLVAYQAAPGPTIYTKTLSGAWTSFITTPPSDAQDLLSINGTVYVGTTTGLSSSTGGPWSLVAGAPTGETALTADSDNNIYIAGQVGSSRNDVCKLSGVTCNSLTPSSPLDVRANALLFVGNTLYAGTNSGLYRWTTGATSWTLAGLANVPIAILTSDSNGNLYIGTVAGSYILPNAG